MEPSNARQTTSRQAFATRTIHAGQTPDPTTGAVMTPIYATSTYAQQSPGVHKGFDYGRTPKSHAIRLRALRGRPGGRARRVSPSPRDWRPSPPCSNCSTTARTCWSATTSTAARTGCSSASAAAARIWTSRYVDPTNLAGVRGGHPAQHADDLDRKPSNPLLKLADLAADRRVGQAARTAVR